MSVSKRWVSKPENRVAVLSRYRSRDCPTIEAIAKELKTTFHNVGYVIQTYMLESEKKALAKVRYSASKTGPKNPMQGKTGETHHNWKGECPDGYGYMTLLQGDERRFVHRIVMAQALGLAELPEIFDVHHIDEDTSNNDLDNLALVTRAAHKAIHFLQAKDSKSLALRRLSIADALKYMT